MVVLPKEKVKAAYTSPRRMVVYGLPKVGKTTLLSELENCLIIDIEDGTSLIDALAVKCSNPMQLDEVCKEIEKNIDVTKNQYPYKYVAIDTVTKLEEWCERLALMRYKSTPIGKNFQGSSVLELPNGAGYFWLRLVFKEWMDRLAKLAPHVIFVGHIKDKMIEKSGKEVSSKDIDLTGKIKTIICQDADAVGYIYRKTDGVYISFKSSDEIACGSRCEHLKGQDLKLEWDVIYKK